ncbi:MAG: hypothetical protein HKN32_09250 [Flavobacteriales bacterium]|nr:hypothetical protein [Flavobacteriales bacterium]
MRLYKWIVPITALCAFFLIDLTVFQAEDLSGFKRLVDLATSISFVIAPLIALVNYRLVSRPQFPSSSRPGKLMKALSYLGIIFLSLFAILFLLVKLGAVDLG